MKIHRLLARALLAAAALAAGAGALALPQDTGLIVKLRDDDAPQRAQARLEQLAARHGVPVLRGSPRALGGRLHVLRTALGSDNAALARRLAADPEVVYAVPDRRARRAAVPSDPLFATGDVVNGPVAGQWYLKSPNATLVSAIDAQAAWDVTQGSASVVVAVLDTGVRTDHPDLAGKLLAGYDFVTQVGRANDGNGRDSDPSDPGDWVTQNDIDTGVVDSDCEVSDSSWHGTQVAGLVGALTNNATGMASVGWNVRVLPVRVLGKCNGAQSDIIAAMRWSAGLSVPGVPANPNPAKVLNLSLGSDGACDAAYADAIAAVRATGAVVVASAGNSEGHAVGSPANCAGAIGVGGLRHIGTKVGFSDLGPEVTISAPAGNCVNTFGSCLYPILTTSNSGTTSPSGSIYTDGSNITVGTSFSAPLVAGTAALMLSARPALAPDDVRRFLMASARAFPTSGAGAGVPQCQAPSGTAQDECYCTTSTCGAGMLDAGAAVQLAADGVLARIDVAPSSPRAGEAVTLDASGSLLASGRSIASVQWSLVDGGGIVTGFASATDTVTASLLPSAAGSVTVSVTVTDSAGASATTSQTIAIAAAAPSTGGGSGGGGGGGAMSPAWLIFLALAAWAAAAATRPRAGKRRRLEPR
ncbi:S8 family serine peptidase [Caldimonas sp. KR1-144]|uniref:S8 family serine peptidase n=1 Tax=Caldimonas sp. KR1-144 TaxID=3400911 RepID=UPI003BFE0AFB